MSSTKSRGYYMGSLDGLRLTSFLIIFIHHMPEVASIAVFAHRGKHGRGRAEAVLIGADARQNGTSALAFDGLRADEGNCGGQGADEGREAREGGHAKAVSRTC